MLSVGRHGAAQRKIVMEVETRGTDVISVYNGNVISLAKGNFVGFLFT